MSLQRCRAETTSMEFVTWCAYLRRDLNNHDKKDFALAQIAAEVRRVLHKNPQNVKAEDFLIRYDTPPTKQDREAQMQKSKSFWLALVATKPQGNQPPGEG